MKPSLTLVERLRLIAAWHTPGGPTPNHKPDNMTTCTEAASLLEQIDAEVQRLTDELDAELDGSANWSKAQHACASVACALLGISIKIQKPN